MDPLELQKQLSPILKPISGLYGAAMRLRDKALRSSFKASCPCISVGNIAWGGAGKTPLVEWFMQWTTRQSLRAAVLSRGYKAKLQNPPVRILPTHSPWEVGDEPLMLAQACPHVPVVVDPVRRRGAEYAMQHLRPQLLILDDGFQHTQLARDLDLVLFRPEDLRGEWNNIIPAGSWREPVTALERAGAFLVKCDPLRLDALTPAIISRLESYGKPVFNFYLEPQFLRKVAGKEITHAPELAQRPYILLTAVGQPDQVRDTVSGYMGYDPVEFITRPDHHRFTFEEVQSLASRPYMVICTAKDAVKLRMLPAPNFWFLETTMRFGPTWWTEQTFPEWWDAWWQQNGQPQQPLQGPAASTGVIKYR